MKVKIFTGYDSNRAQEPANIVMRKIGRWQVANPECIIKDIEVVPYAVGTNSVCHMFVTATVKFLGNETMKTDENYSK
jgi:hypothetical protein